MSTFDRRFSYMYMIYVVKVHGTKEHMH